MGEEGSYDIFVDEDSHGLRLFVSSSHSFWQQLTKGMEMQSASNFARRGSESFPVGMYPYIGERCSIYSLMLLSRVSVPYISVKYLNQNLRYEASGFMLARVGISTSTFT